ncbi:NtaA/DmoA family FMN-dependent monooxygenase [Duganella sp. FT80W]|uniref:NtaA/DmoA family FMN-dependent monooxygenase n=1 Tax=Duganella guangzhouensis TaxID=2666084 RepID=A0A6I2KSP5_9BURK|nr:NtaA/DmoA family FMN-dependent monooxygenase [Duganella guangzhouensis]MRW88511.1 NtaA/DmoA family FMN-dependent monooxygenase [Duganella guangzhouensis]
MAHQPFRLGYFTRFGPTAWSAADDRTYGGDWWTGEHHIQLAQRLEASRGFDFMFFDDTSTVSNAMGGSMDAELKFAVGSPRHEAIPLLPLLAKATRHMGMVCTASTTFYPPFILSRLLNSVDNLSGGRAGWNVVTTSEESAAQNHNYATLPSHGERYEMADEFLDVAKALWSAWQPDALVRDVERNVYVDPAKVSEIKHKGKYFQVRGPLNQVPSPQGKPVLMQAGASPRGRDFAAKHADAVFAPPIGGLDGMKAIRDDIKERAAKFGRNPDEVKVFFAAMVKVLPSADTPIPPLTDAQVEYALLMTAQSFDLDLSQFDLDKPFPLEVESRGSQSMIETLRQAAREGRTLREAIGGFWSGIDELGLIGTPAQIADKMMKAIDYIGGDGFLIIGCDVANGAWNDGVIDGLVPVLQRAGVLRTSYLPGLTLRQTLQQTDWATR